MTIHDKVSQVADYIDNNFEGDLSLELLAAKACVSKYHFHRLFTAYYGLSLHQYIRRLFLKRAANQLLYKKNKSILTIALDCQFDSHEAFTRAFKKSFGMSPKRFREQKSWVDIMLPNYPSPKKCEEVMNVEIRNFAAVRLAVIEHKGDPLQVPVSVNQLIEWCKKEGMGAPKAGDAYAFAYDDPDKTPAKDFRFDLGRVVTKDKKITAPLVEKMLPTSKVAVVKHYGAHEKIGETIYPFYREWLPTSGEELADLPCVFCYQNFAYEVPESALITEVMFFLK